eukprot:5342853-Alexandrium_andersonii.AAC.1
MGESSGNKKLSSGASSARDGSVLKLCTALPACAASSCDARDEQIAMNHKRLRCCGMMNSDGEDSCASTE